MLVSSVWVGKKTMKETNAMPKRMSRNIHQSSSHSMNPRDVCIASALLWVRCEDVAGAQLLIEGASDVGIAGDHVLHGGLKEVIELGGVERAGFVERAKGICG